MTTERAHEPIAIAIEVSEPSVADRLAALLTDLPGVRLAAPGEPADVVLVSPEKAPPADSDAGLTPRARLKSSHCWLRAPPTS